MCKLTSSGAPYQSVERFDEEQRVRVKAQRAAWSERQPPRNCEFCGNQYQPKDQRQCSQEWNSQRLVTGAWSSKT